MEMPHFHRGYFEVHSVIPIELPDFLPAIFSILKSMGDEVISTLVGGCCARLQVSHQMEFIGTVPQYDSLKNAMNTLQYKVKLTITSSLR